MPDEAVPVPDGNQSHPLLITITDADIREQISAELAFCSMAVEGTVIRTEQDLEEARRLAARIEELDREINRLLETKKQIIDGVLAAWQKVEMSWREATATIKATLMKKAEDYLNRRRRDVRKLEEAFQLDAGTLKADRPPQLRLIEHIDVELVSPLELAKAVARGEACAGLVRLNTEYARMLASNRDIPGVKIKRTRRLEWNLGSTNGKP